MVSTEYKVFYSYEDGETFYTRTKDYEFAVICIEEIRKLKKPTVYKIWIEEVRKKVIKVEVLKWRY